MIKLELQSLGKYFGVRWVFRELNLPPTGGVIGISGSNGSGKSTLLRCLAELLKQDRGKVLWHDESGSSETFDVRNQGGFAAPYIQLYKDLTCCENLDFLKSPLVNPPEMELEQLFTSLDIGDKLHERYGSLSSGQQQRVKVIAAVAHQPKVLFLDEPGTNLDARGNTFILNQINLRRQQNQLTIIASNQTTELDLCDHVFSVNGKQ
jgi:ABC-type multidrug transport system ATPase subunit